MPLSSFTVEIRRQRLSATDQLEAALRNNDDFLAELAMARIEELDAIASQNGVEVVA